MAESFKTMLVKDSTIADITPDLGYAVRSGAASHTNQQFPATAQNSSTMIFSVQVPSENIVIGRDMLIETNMGFSFNVGDSSYPVTTDSFANAKITQGTGNLILQWGNTIALQAFPLASLMNTASATINNTSVSTNVKDVLPQLLRLNDSRYLYRFNGMTPSLPDQAYQEYSSGVNAANNPLASYNNASYDLDQIPRGAHYVELYVSHYGNGFEVADDGTETAVNNILIGQGEGTTNLAQSQWANSGNAPTGETYTYYNEQWWVVEVKTKVTEPIFISPLTWSSPEHNSQGLLGINNMSFNFSLDSTFARLLSEGSLLTTETASTGVSQSAVRSVVAGASDLGQDGMFADTQMLLKFLSTQPSDRLDTKNVVPFMDFPRYITNANSSNPIAAGGETRLLTNNLQLNQIPDYFLVCVRKPMVSQTIQDANSFFAIKSISVNLNNASGLLSSATQQDLWKMSMKNGSTQSWAEFSGKQWDSTEDGGSSVGTTGSLLVLAPPYDLSLPDYLTSGSLGNFNFQIQLNVENVSTQSIAPEVQVICVNSGIFCTQQGVSSVYSGILTREMTLKTKSQKPESAESGERLVGGRKFLNMSPVRKTGGAYSGGKKHSAESGSSLSGMY
jgi:hypothetical protein